MILWMISVGFLSAFALGPASFSIIRSLVSRRTWPWSSIAGFLLGDVTYILLAMALLKSPLFHQEWLKITLTGMTALVLSAYSLKVLLSKEQPATIEIPHQGFTKSLALTLSNFHLVLIYAGLFVHLRDAKSLWLGVLVYLLTFVVSFLALLWGLKRLHGPIKQFLRKIEIVAACGFFCFSIYLSVGIL
ncbi:hypothetical protein [Bdellovibrio bacteriovorus]|uniref:Lysine transporter LysE n=1 Tax=Bdellovibrio bacteriovorus str. Tiberius TaxID=1069642 RepID=K7ZFM5_BDEBC|nr:hypothetical protein [Bdellovibrio bacteriovorus]AFY01647.1 hypothetical protein Bdt_1960 [Bdellovibrio bacteriovorus str. Tiberius]